MSYANFMLYGAVLPTYESGKNNQQGQRDEIHADDPRNRARVRQFFDNCD